MKSKIFSVIKGAEHFQERVDEIDSSISFDTIKQVVAELKDLLYSNKEMVAVCAPQIGEHLRLFIVRNGQRDEGRFKIFLNPMIVNGKDFHLSREICDSIPDKQFIIPRRNEIHVAYQEIDGRVNSETFLGAYAEVVQQMIDLLDGITLEDYGLDLDDLGGPEAFDKATQKEKFEVLQMYINNLKNYSVELSDEIAASPELTKLNDSIEFTASVLAGTTQLKKSEQSELEKQ